MKFKSFKTFFVISLLLNTVGFFFVAKRLYWSYFKNKSNPQTDIYREARRSLFEVLPKDTGCVIFLGTSLTQSFEISELIKNKKIKNRGINGDDIPAILNRLQSIIKTEPSKIFLEVGINDLIKGVKEENIIKNYKHLIDTLYITCKSAKIYVESILPVSNLGETSSILNDDMNKEILRINDSLSKYSSEKNFIFINVYKHFVYNNEIKKNYTFDGFHLTGEAYLLLAEVLKPYIEE